jgi:hypothetical protein
MLAAGTAPGASIWLAAHPFLSYKRLQSFLPFWLKSLKDGCQLWAFSDMGTSVDGSVFLVN